MSTHVKKILAISLCLVMCLSSLAVLAPSASAAEPAAPMSSPTGGGGYVCITFDDGSQSQYDVAYAAMSAAGIPGTLFMMANAVGADGYINASQLLEMEANGWEIGSHGYHSSFPTLSPEDAMAELTQSKADLEAIGLTIESFAWPFGDENEALVEMASTVYTRQRDTGYDGPEYLRHFTDSMWMVGAVEPKKWTTLTKYIDEAVHTDSVIVLYYHSLTTDGTLYGCDYTIHDLIEYVQLRQATHGLDAIRFKDLSSIGNQDVYEWVASEAGNASDGANWAGGVAPGPGDHLVFPQSAKGQCTLDQGIRYGDIQMMKYSGEVVVTQPGLVADGLSQLGGKLTATGGGPTVSIYEHIYLSPAAGGWGGTLKLALHNAHMSLGLSPLLSKLDVYGDVSVLTRYVGSLEGSRVINIQINPLSVHDGARMVLHGVKINYVYKYTGLENGGEIRGKGMVNIPITDIDSRSNITLGACHVPVNIYLHATKATTDKVLTLTGPSSVRDLTVTSEHATSTMTLDLDGHSLISDSITVGARAVLVGGDGTITTSAWDSTAGTWTPEESTVVLRDGGTVKLAPGQSFNALYIASDDGRTASWTMTATGAQAPTVYGLRPGSVHTWYLDGVEQGEVTADEHGTIALSYTSTGLHTLSVGPDPDAPAPISDMIGQYAWLIVGAAGVMALVVYAVAARHPLVLIVGIGLLLIAALLHLGVI